MTYRHIRQGGIAVPEHQLQAVAMFGWHNCVKILVPRGIHVVVHDGSLCTPHAIRLIRIETERRFLDTGLHDTCLYETIARSKHVHPRKPRRLDDSNLEPDHLNEGELTEDGRAPQILFLHAFLQKVPELCRVTPGLRRLCCCVKGQPLKSFSDCQRCVAAWCVPRHVVVPQDDLHILVLPIGNITQLQVLVPPGLGLGHLRVGLHGKPRRGDIVDVPARPSLGVLAGDQAELHHRVAAAKGVCVRHT
mmetsp:Transcript_80841/g.228830  ORF Transcript_80841/g.228830 Transcript_80841/m.228830 type:complete len:248 (-) Transcript_80841:175-918(-)